MKPRQRVIHIGDKGIYERTDPDYQDKIMSKLVKDYRACPKEWREAFMAGLPAKERTQLLERLNAIWLKRLKKL